MKLIKFTTQNLVCYHAKDSVGNSHYQIYELDKYDKPVCIYVDRSTMHLADELPLDITTYKFFEELKELIELLYKLN